MLNRTLGRLPVYFISFNRRINGSKITRLPLFRESVTLLSSKPSFNSKPLCNCIVQSFHSSSSRLSAQVINVPPFADSITEGDAKFLVKIGAQVKVDEVVAEIETDKTTVPVPSPCAGTVKEFLVNDGDTVKPGQPLYSIEKA